LPNCKYTLGNYEGDYENLNGHDDLGSGKTLGKPTFQQAGNHTKRYVDFLNKCTNRIFLNFLLKKILENVFLS